VIHQGAADGELSTPARVASGCESLAFGLIELRRVKEVDRLR
jgi:hypothetical protein